MKTKSKTILFVFAFALIFSVVSVSCFASVEQLVPGGRYTPSSDPSVYPDEQSSAFAGTFTINGEIYYSVGFDSGGLFFLDSEGNVAIGYLPLLGWIDPLAGTSLDVQFITFTSFSGTDEEYSLLCSVLDEYVESDPGSFYNQIFNSLSGAVFGEDDLTPEQNLSLSLISTVLSIGLVLLPVLLAIGFLLRCFRL